MDNSNEKAYFDDRSCYVLLSVCFFIIVSNVFALLVLHRIHDMHDITKQLMMVLTTADLAVGLNGLLERFLQQEALHFVSIFFQMVGLIVLSLITVVRYIAVSQPLRLNTIVTKKRVFIALFCATIPCFILSCNLIVTFTSNEDQKTAESNKRISILMAFAFIAVPPLIIITLYVKLL